MKNIFLTMLFANECISIKSIVFIKKRKEGKLFVNNVLYYYIKGLGNECYKVLGHWLKNLKNNEISLENQVYFFSKF